MSDLSDPVQAQTTPPVLAPATAPTQAQVTPPVLAPAPADLISGQLQSSNISNTKWLNIQEFGTSDFNR